jgi:hypothetical protein
MSARTALGNVRRLGGAKASISTVTTTAFDFGTPNDLKIPSLANFQHGDRILLVLHNTTAGTTDTTSWTIQDADDNAGSIGTPAAADTKVLSGSLSGGTGDQYCVVSVTPKSGRPWLRVNLVRGSGTTDTVVGTVSVLAIPGALV